MSSVSGSELAFDVVERLEPLPGMRAAHDDPAVVHGMGVERVDRLAELDHDVVARVDDVAHGPLTCGQQPHLDAVRRRADGHAAHPAPDEPRAQRGILDLHRQAFGGRPARLDELDWRQLDRRAGHRRDLARETDDRQRVAAVRLDVDVEHDVAVHLAQRRPDRGRLGQDQDPVAVRGEVELLARAQHPVRDDTHLLGPLDPAVARQHRPGQRHRNALADRDVRRAADDLQRLALADRYARQ